MSDFIMAALPLVVVGLALAVFFAGRAHRKKEKKEAYEAEGMSLGMCAGTIVGTFFPEYIGITLSLGMLIGLLIGMCIEKKED